MSWILDKFVSRPAPAEPPKPPKLGRLKRGVGFCRTEGCKLFNSGRFLLGTEVPDTYHCTSCFADGMVVKEQVALKDPNNMLFRQVRVEYNYKPSLEPLVHEGKYTATAIVTDEAVDPDANVYTVYAPLICTEKAALKTAEGLLGCLMQNPQEVIEEGWGSKPRELVIDFDRPLGNVKSQLFDLQNKLEGSKLANETK